MQRLLFTIFCLIATALARRSTPESPPRAYLPRGYPYGWGMPNPALIDPVEEPKENKKTKQVKRVVKKTKQDDTEAQMHDLRWGAVQDMINGLE